MILEIVWQYMVMYESTDDSGEWGGGGRVGELPSVSYIGMGSEVLRLLPLYSTVILVWSK